MGQILCLPQISSGCSRPSNLEQGRSNTDLVTGAQNKSRPFDKHNVGGGC